MDWWSRKVLAWRLSNTMDVQFCLDALDDALDRHGTPEIFNTDQGSQFIARAWTQRLKIAGTRISMGGRGRFLDNIFIERLWRSLKYECVYLHAFSGGLEARQGIGAWVPTVSVANYFSVNYTWSTMAIEPIEKPIKTILERFHSPERFGRPSAVASSPFRKGIATLGLRSRRLFQLPHPSSTGLHFVGAILDPSDFGYSNSTGPTSATGKGTSLENALISCLGEATEYILQHAPEELEYRFFDDPSVESGLDGNAFSHLVHIAGLSGADAIRRASPWIPARRLNDDAIVWVPGSLCYRGLLVNGRTVPSPPLKLGSGCGVGETLEAAILHGLLETVERDAVAMWWLGGNKATKLDHHPSAQKRVDDILGTSQNDRGGRRTWLLDITSDIDVPSVVAVSCDDRGRGLACGFSASLEIENAISSAVLEMCQMEMAVHLVQLKRAQLGDTSLVAQDIEHLRRHYDLAVPKCWALLSTSNIRDHNWRGVDSNNGRVDANADLQNLLEKFARMKLGVYLIELSSAEIDVHCAKIIVDNLHPFPSSTSSIKLTNAIEHNGGGFGLTTDIKLI